VSCLIFYKGDHYLVRMKYKSESKLRKNLKSNQQESESQ